MSRLDSDLPVEELLKRGKEAVRAGDKTAGRALLEKVVTRDQNSELGWFWLAAAVDDLTEKRTCLGNVLVINPDNERARNLLDQLNQTEPAAPGPAEPITLAGADQSRRTPYYWLGGVGALMVLTLVAFLLLRGSSEDEQPDTPVSLRATVAAVVQDANPLPTPGATAGPMQPTAPLPPTWTPKPSSTPDLGVLPTVFPAPPANLPGQIIMRSGPFLGDRDNQSIVLIKPDGSTQHNLTPDNSRGHAPVLSPDSSRFAYIKDSPGVGQAILQIDNMLNTAPVTGSTYWSRSGPLFNVDTPAWSPDGAWLALVAQGGGSTTIDLFRVSLANPGSADSLQRLTNDNTVESWPAWSPDSQRIVYVADRSAAGVDGTTELQIVNTVDGQVSNLTTNGAELIESAPDWSPDGQRIIFDAREVGQNQRQIYEVTPGGTPTRLFESDANDIQPRYSPDGRYIVFSSDRSGNWDVYIYEITTGTFYQVTTSTGIDVANDWGR